MRRWAWLALFSGLALLAAQAQAQSANLPPPGERVLDGVLQAYTSIAQSWVSVLQSNARFLFYNLAVISLAWTMGTLALKQADLQAFFGETVKFFVTTGFFFWLLDNGPDFATKIIDSFTIMGTQAASASGGVTEKMTPSLPLQYAIQLTGAALGSWLNLDPIQYLTTVVISIVILLCYATIAANYLMALVTGYILAYAGIFILGFGGSRWTSDMAINYYRSIIAVGLEIMTIILLLGVGVKIETGMLNAVVAGNSRSHDLLVVLCISAVLAFLVHRAPGRVAALVGHGSGGGVSVGGVAGAAALAAGGVASVAMGAVGAATAVKAAMGAASAGGAGAAKAAGGAATSLGSAMGGGGGGGGGASSAGGATASGAPSTALGGGVSPGSSGGAGSSGLATGGGGSAGASRTASGSSESGETPASAESTGQGQASGQSENAEASRGAGAASVGQSASAGASVAAEAPAEGSDAGGAGSGNSGDASTQTEPSAPGGAPDSPSARSDATSRSGPSYARRFAGELARGAATAFMNKVEISTTGGRIAAAIQGRAPGTRGMEQVSLGALDKALADSRTADAPVFGTNSLSPGSEADQVIADFVRGGRKDGNA